MRVLLSTVLGLALLGACTPYRAGEGLRDHAEVIRTSPDPEARAGSAAKITSHVRYWGMKPWMRPTGGRLWMERQDLTDAVVPTLTVALHDPDSDVRAEAARALAGIAEFEGALIGPAVPALAHLLDGPVIHARAEAAYALAAMGPALRAHASHALGPLSRHVKDAEDDTAGRAARALAILGAPAVPALEAATLEASAGQRRYPLALALVDSLKHARHRDDEAGINAASDALARLVATPDRDVALAALNALCDWTDHRDTGVAAYSEGLREAVVARIAGPDPELQELAARALAAQGGDATTAVETLEAVVRNGDRPGRARTNALMGIVSVTGPTTSTLTLLRDLLADPATPGDLRYWAEYHLGHGDRKAWNDRLPR